LKKKYSYDSHYEKRKEDGVGEDGVGKDGVGKDGLVSVESFFRGKWVKCR
jgi:hypothetical protein